MNTLSLQNCYYFITSNTNIWYSFLFSVLNVCRNNSKAYCLTLLKDVKSRFPLSLNPTIRHYLETNWIAICFIFHDLCHSPTVCLFLQIAISVDYSLCYTLFIWKKASTSSFVLLESADLYASKFCHFSSRKMLRLTL